jgi:Protein of unknown function (DUF1592)/Protein of unknown function (DUF1588)/Protein of unknown function (DUF1585)/Protein of unknown function (DUF1587)/Protein of unknown function (DUF1595)/Planctomycete cytochrome C
MRGFCSSTTLGTGRRALHGLLVVAVFGLAAGCGRDAAPDLDQTIASLTTYCVECHNDIDFTADLSLESVSAAHLADHPEVWEAIVRKLRGNLMPPPGSDRPDYADVRQAVSTLETALDARAAEAGPMPGRVSLHRLNRTEYARAIREILAIDIDADAILPPDVTSGGFDNVADVLRVSPTHLDQYIAAARDISIRAVGNPNAGPVRADFRSTLENGSIHVDGLPLGTRGGMLIDYDFPADGEYVFNVNIISPARTPLRAYPTGWAEYRHTLILTVDGVRVFEQAMGGEEDSRDIDQNQMPAVVAIKDRFRDIALPVKAGRHEIGVTWIARSHAEGDYLLEDFVPGQGVPDIPRVAGTEIIGPYNTTGIGESVASRDRIFICRPSNEDEALPCARQILGNLARQAFRRPVDENDLAPVLGFYEQGAREGGFETGIQKGLMAVLASTKFLYRAEPGGMPANATPGSAYPISDIELAWRLSFFLWSTVPDDELLALAAENRLGDADVLDAQVTRMLDDPRAKSLVTNFGFQWLEVRGLKQIQPDTRLFPDFDEDLRAAFVKEMELFLESILLGDASVVDLLTAKYTFVNDRLARHYGIPDVRTDAFRRVELTDSHRFGLLGKGSVLLVTSYPDRTSPVLRGTWIMEHLLGTPPSSPPPGVETNLTAVEGARPASVRERLEMHRSVPSCNHCHGVIDPYGQPLESFDAVGEWRVRERDSGVAVDPVGIMAGTGRQVTGPEDLREALAADPDQFVQTLTEKAMTFALGRGVEYYDMPTVRAIVDQAEAADYRFEAIVRGIVKSPAFTMRAAPETDTVVGARDDETGAGPRVAANDASAH